jgi:hypothetical protein
MVAKSTVLPLKREPSNEPKVSAFSLSSIRAEHWKKAIKRM